MATKALNLKVKTEKVIKALETALSDIRKKQDDHKKAEEAHKKALAEWRKKVITAIGEGKVKAEEDFSSHGWRNEPPKVNITFALPASLAQPKEPESDFPKWSVNNDIEELENAIALLKMTDEEYVSAATYKGVARFIR